MKSCDSPRVTMVTSVTTPSSSGDNPASSSSSSPPVGKTFPSYENFLQMWKMSLPQHPGFMKVMMVVVIVITVWKYSNYDNDDAGRNVDDDDDDDDVDDDDDDGEISCSQPPPPITLKQLPRKSCNDSFWTFCNNNTWTKRPSTVTIWKTQCRLRWVSVENLFGFKCRFLGFFQKCSLFK